MQMRSMYETKSPYMVMLQDIVSYGAAAKKTALNHIAGGFSHLSLDIPAAKLGLSLWARDIKKQMKLNGLRKFIPAGRYVPSADPLVRLLVLLIKTRPNRPTMRPNGIEKA